jgi:hypothetical protein
MAGVAPFRGVPSCQRRYKATFTRRAEGSYAKNTPRKPGLLNRLDRAGFG